MPVLVGSHLVGRNGTRAHQTHFAPEDVEKLGQFVQAGPAKDPSDARDSGIAGQLDGFRRIETFLHERFDVRLVQRLAGVLNHRSKLVHVEMDHFPQHFAMLVTPPGTDALLNEQNGTAGIQLDQRGNREQERQ